jgi:hypothetical protein
VIDPQFQERNLQSCAAGLMTMQAEAVGSLQTIASFLTVCITVR